MSNLTNISAHFKRWRCVCGLILYWITSSTAEAWSISNVLISGTKASIVYTDSVALGIQRGMEECKAQYAWERWNCPDQVFTKTKLLPANKETAFVHAITAAGVTYSVTKNCSLGHFEGCGCSENKLNEKGGHKWKWEGCSDNIEFGFEISRDFLDAREHGKDPKAVVTRHNNQAGRQAVLRTMKKMCKCHGVSGSCSIQTCWMQLSDFRSVGFDLKNRYDNATKLDYVNGILSLGQTPESSLVYLEDPPNYCLANLTAGSHGTVGRECSYNLSKGKKADRLSPDKNSCRTLCRQCGLKVRKRKAIISVSCNCKFNWCCEVKCQTCRRKVNIHTCVIS